MAQLQQPIAIFPQFIAQKEETLFITEGGFGPIKNDFNITFPDGTLLFRTDSHNFTSKRQVFDAAGNHLFTIVHTTLLPLTDLNVNDPSGKSLIKLKNHFTSKASRSLSHVLR